MFVCPKLQAERMGFSDIPNHKAILETTLRKHATLSQDIFTIGYGEPYYRLRVLELKPATSVSILETDIEVDIEGSDSVLDSSKNQHVFTPLVIGKAELGTVEEGMFNHYKFSIEDNISDRIASGSMNIKVRFEAETSDGDTDIYVSRHHLVFPTQHLHEWSSRETGSKVLILDPKDPNSAAGTYGIGIFGLKGLTRYHISLVLKDNNTQRVGENAMISSQFLNSVECQNYRRFILRTSIMLHEAYCIRHCVLCQHDGCRVVLRKEEVGQHKHCNKRGKACQQ